MVNSHFKHSPTDWCLHPRFWFDDLWCIKGLSTLRVPFLTLIFARGTFEEGNIGSLVGPPVVDALVSMLGEAQVAVQGVSHNPADPQDYLFGEGSVTGSQDFAALIAQAMT